MRSYLLAAACLALASCSATKSLPQYTEAEKAAQRGGVGYWQPAPEPADTTPRQHRPPVWSPADSVLWAHHRQAHQVDSVVVARPPSLLDKLLRRTPAPYHVAVTPARIGKKSTVSIYYGAATITNTTAGKKATVAAGTGAVASVVEKKAGPAIVASDSSTLNALTGGGNLAAVHGDGNTLPQTATTQQAADWRATLAKPAGAVLAGVLTVVLVGGSIFLIAAYRRRKNLANNG